MRCESCQTETADLFDLQKGCRSLRVCRTCLEKEDDEKAHGGEGCRCKESIGKTPADIGRLILDDLKFWKK